MYQKSPKIKDKKVAVPCTAGFGVTGWDVVLLVSLLIAVRKSGSKPINAKIRGVFQINCRWANCSSHSDRIWKRLKRTFSWALDRPLSFSKFFSKRPFWVQNVKLYEATTMHPYMVFFYANHKKPVNDKCQITSLANNHSLICTCICSPWAEVNPEVTLRKHPCQL